MNSSVRDRFFTHYNKIENVNGIRQMLGWDQQAIMPDGAAEQRSRELGFLDSLAHQYTVEPEYESALRALVESTSEASEKAAILTVLKKVLIRKKVPGELIEKLSRHSAQSFESWKNAKEKNDFSLFAADLEKIILLQKEYAHRIKETGESDYSALVGEYDPGVSAGQVKSVLSGLQAELVPLVQEILEHRKKSAPLSKESGDFSLSIDQQEDMNRRVLIAMGFDFKHGRLDRSVHPFSGGSGADIRLTTRYNEKDFTSSLLGVLHEGGHGIYEQGMEKEISFKPLRTYAGMATHESQSRFWENSIGRSLPFCEWLVKSAHLKVSPPQLHAHMNDAKQSRIRVDADEATYNLHILIRYEIESALFDGYLKVSEIPHLWNEKMKSYLGLEPAKMSEGCLQDIHWSLGSFGYFPSYTLGNLIAAQIFETVSQKVDVPRCTRDGKLTEVRDWLNKNVHALGCQYNTLELVKKVTGKELSHQPFITSLKRKFLAE